MHSARVQLLAEVLAFALLALWSCSLYGLGLGAQVIVTLLAVYAVPRMAYERVRFRSRAGSWVLTGVGLLLVAVAVQSMWDCTLARGVTMEVPVMNSDDWRYYRWALHHYDQRIAAPKTPFVGLPVTMLLLWRLLGVSLLWPVAFNILLALVAFIFVGQTAVRVLGGRVDQQPAVIASTAMGLSATLFFLLAQVPHVQKEAGVLLSMTLLAFALARRRDDSSPWWPSAIVACVGLFVLAFYRASAVYMVVPGSAMLLLAQWRSRNRTYALVVMALTVGWLLVGLYASDYTLQKQGEILFSEKMNKSYLIGNMPSQAPYEYIIGNYFSYPMWRRILLLPVTMAVQFIVPFPWVYVSHGVDWGDLLCRIQWGWYFVGGLSIYYFVFRAWGRDSLGWWPWWVAFMYAVPAYTVAGSVTRYVLPIEPLFAILATYVVLRLNRGRWHDTFKSFIIGYTVLLLTALTLCFNIQSSYLDELDHYYEQVVRDHRNPQ